jgi:hypothetical protein
MLSKWLAVGESRTIGGRSLRQKSVAVATVMENVMKRVEAPCWRNTLETLPQRKSSSRHLPPTDASNLQIIFSRIDYSRL